MALVYSATGSLDGYVADTDGGFAFAEPDEELHAFVNDVFGRAGTILSGRRSYELMDIWDTGDLDTMPEVMAQFACHWRAVDKVVYSRTLEEVTHPRTRLERSFEPDAVRALVRERPDDVMIGGAELGGEAFRAGIVDEVWTFLLPITIGAGAAMFPTDSSIELDLLEQHRFGSGAVGMRYRVRS